MNVRLLTATGRFIDSEARFLTDAGFHLYSFTSADDLDRISHDTADVDLCVLDHVVPPSVQERVFATLAQQRGGSPLPVLVVTADSRREPVWGLGADQPTFVHSPLSSSELKQHADWVLSRAGKLGTVLRQVLSPVTNLVLDSGCEWVRTSLGVFGCVAIEDRDLDAPLTHLHTTVRHCYALLDGLPEERLSFEDLWNLLLFVSIPRSRTDLSSRVPVMRALSQIERDTTGSRKIALYKGSSPVEFVASVNVGTSSWTPVAGDPLREALDSVCRDDVERNALESLFRRRIPESDVDQVIRALGRDL